eukprot:393386_1
MTKSKKECDSELKKRVSASSGETKASLWRKHSSKISALSADSDDPAFARLAKHLKSAEGERLTEHSLNYFSWNNRVRILSMRIVAHRYFSKLLLYVIFM